MIPLSEPWITKEDRETVSDALESSWINTAGPYVDKLERLLELTTGASNAVLTANGTSGLFLALKALGIGPGKKVAVPSITFVATINSIIHIGAEPVFFDCYSDLNINTDQLEEYLYENKVDCIMPVHIFGNPCDMDKIIYLSKKYNIPVIEDSCEAIGSKYNNQSCGTIGNIGVFSFSFNKMITSGNGGCILTNNKKYADKIKYWSTQSKDDPVNYIHNEVGYNLGLTNIQAALGYSQLKRLDQFLAKKKYIYNLYNNRLGDKILSENGSNHWFIGYQTKNKDEIMTGLKDKEIQTRPLWFPNHLQIPFKHYSRVGSLSNSLMGWDQTVNLPCGVNLSSEEVNYICDIIQEIEE